MSDSVSQVKFLKAVGLAVEKEALVFTHDYGEVPLPWDSITHAFLVIWERKMSSAIPLFVMRTRDSDYFYYIDGNTLSMKALKMGEVAEDTSTAKQLDMTVKELKKSKEEDFKRIIREIIAKSPSILRDRTVNPYLSGAEVNIPKFPKLKLLYDYCSEAMSKMDSGQDMEEPAAETPPPQAPSELPTLEIPRPKAPEVLTRGMLIDNKYSIVEVAVSETEIRYTVLDPDYNTIFEMKTLPKIYWDDQGIIELFTNQAALWTRMESHSNLVRAELYKKINGIPHIFIEHVEGSTLESLTRTESLSVKSAMEVGIQICRGMDFAFSQNGKPHGDIRPSKCLITGEDVLKMADFGMIRVVDRISCGGTVEEKCVELGDLAPPDFPLYGSLPFMAPELFTDMNEMGIKSDIYSLGVTLYRLLTDINPFSADTPSKIMKNHLTLKPLNPQKLNPRVPEALAGIVSKCLEKAPELRYENFSEIKAELEHIYEELTGSGFESPKIEKAMSEDYWINRGLSLKSMDRAEEAGSAFDEALAVNPESIRARFYKGSSLEKRISEGMSENQDNWEYWFWTAESQAEARDTQKALQSFDRSIELSGDVALTWAEKGKLLADTGKPEDALECYNAALSRAPRAAELLDDKGSLLLKMKQHTPALDCFKEAAALNPAFKWPHYHQGQALFKLGAFNEAIQVLQHLMEMDPQFYRAPLLMGDCYSEMDKKKEAIQAYESAIAIQDNALEPYLACIQILKEGSKWERALEFITRALEISPADRVLILDQVEVLFRLGHYEESQTLCRGFLEKNPEDEDAELLRDTISLFEREQESMFKSIFSTPPIPVESYANDLGSLLSVFCSPKDALSFVESRKEVDTSYLRMCLHYLEGDYEKALAQSAKALEDPANKDKAQKIKKRLEENPEKAPKKKDLFGLARKLTKRDSESLDELVINGFEKIRNNAYHDARAVFREILTKHPAAYFAIYCLARTYDLENNLEKSQHYWNEFAKYAPHSIGYCREKVSSNQAMNPVEAEKTFHRVMGSYPNDCDPYLEYLKFLSIKGYGEKLHMLASGLLRESFREWAHLEGSSIYWNTRAFLQIYLGRFKAAKESLSKAMELDRDNIVSVLGMSKYCEAMDQLEEANELLKNLLVKEESSGIASYLMSDIFLKQKQELKALGTVDNALQKFPGALPLMYKRAQISSLQKMSSELDEMYHKIEALDGSYVPMKNLWGILLLEQGKVEEAVSEVSSLLSREQGNLVLFRNLGFLYIQAEDYEHAFSTFNGITEAYPLNYETHMGLGMIQYSQKSYEKALECFERALELNPQDPELWLYLGAVDFHQGHLADSANCWDNAIFYRSKFPTAWINKGTYFYSRENYRKALQCADSALLIEPGNLEAIILKARCELKSGRADEGAKILEQAVSSHENDMRLWWAAGILDFYRNDYVSSLQKFQRAAGDTGDKGENKPPRGLLHSASLGKGKGFSELYSGLWYNRALLGLYMRDYDAAEIAIKRALEIDPGFGEIYLLRCAASILKAEPEGRDSLFQEAQKRCPEKFAAWSEEFEKKHDPLSMLKPMEFGDDPFILPVDRPLIPIQPIGLFHLLSNPCALIVGSPVTTPAAEAPKA